MQAQSFQGASQDGAREDALKNEAPASCVSPIGAGLQTDPFGITGSTEVESQPPYAQSEPTANAERCISAKFLFPLDTAGLTRRDKSSQRKKIVAVEQLVNKVRKVGSL